MVPEGDAALPPEPEPEPPPLPADPVGDHVDAWSAIADVLCECAPSPPANLEECLDAIRFSDTFRPCAERAYASFPEDTVREGLQCTNTALMQLRNCHAEGMCDEAAFELCSLSYVETVEGCWRIGRTAELFNAFYDCSEPEER